MKNNTSNASFAARAGRFLLCFLLFLILSYIKANGAFREIILLPCVFLLLTIIIVTMALGLRTALKTQFYSYRCISLVAALLFVGVLWGTLFVYFVSCIRDPGRLHPDKILILLLLFPRRFSYGAVFVLVAVSMAVCVSNVALIHHEGFRLKNLLGFLIGTVYIGGTLALYRLTDHLRLTAALLTEDTVSYIGVYLLSAFLPLFLLILLCYFECFFAGTMIMGYAAARKIPQYDKDYIIIPGCAISRSGGLLPLLKGRTNRALRFAWDQEIATGKKVLYIPSGGRGHDEIMSEGSAMELYLLSHGAEEEEIRVEKQSANTYENMLFSKSIIDREKPDARVAFATTNYHILRSGILARRVGLNAEGIASCTKWYFRPNGFLREYIAILADTKKTHLSALILDACLCLLLFVLTMLN